MGPPQLKRPPLARRLISMCLVVAVRLPFARRAELTTALRPPAVDRIDFLVQPDRRWWPARLLGPPAECLAEFVLEEGGCGCAFLSDTASFEALTWSMEPASRERLANALSAVLGSLRGDVLFSAMWVGDKPKER